MLVGRDGGGKACEASYETSWGVQDAASKVRTEREPAVIPSHTARIHSHTDMMRHSHTARIPSHKLKIELN